MEVGKSVVLVTGATGCVGSRTVVELLRASAARVVLLVRGASQADACDRMNRVLRYWSLDPEVPELAERIRVVRGDILEPELGLEPGEREALARELTHIVHCATDIKLNLPLDQAREVSVGGTRNAVALARRCQANGQFRGFSFLSTLEVAGDYRGVIYEEFLTEYRRGFLNTYEQTKAEAEEYLREQHAQGLPVTVFRTSMVVGDSETGKTTRFGSFYYLLADMLLDPPSRLMPGSDRFVIDTVPVDFLARVIVRLYDEPSAVGAVYHPMAGAERAINLTDFVARAPAHLPHDVRTRPARFISPALVRGVLRAVRPLTSGALRRSVDRQLLFLEFFFVSWQFDTARLRAVIEPEGLEIPRLLDYLPALCHYYLAQRTGRGGIPRELAVTTKAER
ncbi:MAG: SDR family oxidoreductase [Ectothiorhodospiraceae bacterium]|nr:SDR family oxidoreductase [Chromatiales bacterium]MCP5154882.1 SDR family oxidoreductase [Ectothiorhodospiraceae bacterium]